MATVINISKMASYFDPNRGKDEYVYWLEVRFPLSELKSGVLEKSDTFSGSNYSTMACSLEFHKINDHIRIFIKFPYPYCIRTYIVTYYEIYNAAICSSNTSDISYDMCRTYTCIGGYRLERYSTINGHILMFFKIEEKKVQDLDIDIPKNVTSAKFLSLYKKKELTDFKIVCEDKEFFVHKIILICQSNVFKTMLENHAMKESQEDVLIISDFQPKIVEAMIIYLYSDEMTEELSEEELKQLLMIANKYNIDSLKKSCLKQMCKLVKEFKKALEIIEFIEAYNFDDLKKLMIRFMKSNAYLLGDS